MTTEQNPTDLKESPSRQRYYLGSFINGKFWCDCDPPRRAQCFTTKGGPNKGRKRWVCGREMSDPQKCHLFIWDDDAEAREWLKEHGPQRVPETPSKKTYSPKSPETPWTKAKRKPISREVSDENENGGPSNRKVEEGDVFDGEDEGIGSPSRKTAKATRFSTPGGQSFNDRLREAAIPPTPEMLDKGKGKAVEPAPIQAANISPNPMFGAVMETPNLTRGRLDDLTTRVLSLLRDEDIQLKESTELELRHELGLESDLNAARVKRYEETISKQSRRLDELETMVEHLTGSGSVDEPIELD